MKASIRLLLVDDNPADVGLAREALSRTSHHSAIESVEDGVEALAFLNRRGKYAQALQPDLVILDLSLPKRNGLAVLAAMKAGPQLRHIPVVVFSSSRLSQDITRSYELGASSYVSKPGNLTEFFSVVKSIEDFWCDTASVPPRGE